MKYDGSETWFDVLADEATNDAADWLSYCSAAKKQAMLSPMPKKKP